MDEQQTLPEPNKQPDLKSVNRDLYDEFTSEPIVHAPDYNEWELGRINHLREFIRKEIKSNPFAAIIINKNAFIGSMLDYIPEFLILANKHPRGHQILVESGLYNVITDTKK